MLNQQDHILSGKEQASRYCQRGSQGSIYKFTYELEMRNETKWSEGLVLNQQLHVHPGNKNARQSQKGEQWSINKFTYSLEIRKRNGVVSGVISAQPINLRTTLETRK